MALGPTPQLFLSEGQLSPFFLFWVTLEPLVGLVLRVGVCVEDMRGGVDKGNPGPGF